MNRRIVSRQATHLFAVLALAPWLLLAPPSSAEDREEPPGPPISPVSTIEDIYGDTGEFFQAAIGLLTLEKLTATYPDPEPSYGVGVDDMVFTWKEIGLADDAADCGPGGSPGDGGACAVVDLQTVNFFEGRTVVEVTVLESSPPPANDCDLDGATEGTNDCDGDGAPDLVVKMTSEAEPSGEIVFANLVGDGFYRVEVPVSSLYDVNGVLFVQPVGTHNATVTAIYQDDDDGTGQICKNAVDPAAWGRVEASATLVLPDPANVVLEGVILNDNGDDDGWADTDETVSMRIILGNKTGVDLTGIVARLQSNDPRIECVIDAATAFGDLPAGESALSAEVFRFKVADVQREGTCSVGLNVCRTDADCTAGGGDACSADLEDFTATLAVTLAGDQFEGAMAPQTVTLDLDLDAAGGTIPGDFTEGFESGAFGSFTSQNIDDGRNNFAGSEGYRCQYTDPDWWRSNSYGQIADCYLAATPGQAAAFWWQNNGPGDEGGNRAYEGTHSVYMGYYDPAVETYTTPLGTLEALRTSDPIHIGWDRVCETTRTIPCSDPADCPDGEACVGVNPRLSFKHQISLADSRNVSTEAFESADGAVAMIQLAAPDGTPVGNWIKVQPTLNVYDQQRTDNFTNCFFDPVDDGTTEDDYFDPSDPNRRLGPSSMCFPEFTWVHQGDTDAPFNPAQIGNASDGPGLEGSVGGGTWVEVQADLSRFRGRSLYLRFMSSAVKAGTVETWEQLFGWNTPPLATDDGWWVDDIRISDALLGAPAIVSTDVKDNSGLPGCGGNCTSVTAALEADPAASLPAPGQVVRLSAAGDPPSAADRCLGGTLQYRFRTGSEVIRSWTDNPVLVQAPVVTTTYSVDVRCSSLPTCADSADRTVVVLCPANDPSRLLGAMQESLRAFPGFCAGAPEEFCTDDSDCVDIGPCAKLPRGATQFLSWIDEAKGKRIRLTGEAEGSGPTLAQGKASRSYAYESAVVQQDVKGYLRPAVPQPGSFFWYLVAYDSEDACTVGGSWQTAVGAEPERDRALP